MYRSYVTKICIYTSFIFPELDLLREDGDIQLNYTSTQSFRLLKYFGHFYWILIGWFHTSNAQTLQLISLKWSRGNICLSSLGMYINLSPIVHQSIDLLQYKETVISFQNIIFAINTNYSTNFLYKHVYFGFGCREVSQPKCLKK